MRLQVLVSTMNQDDFSLVGKMRINSNAIIVNQCKNMNKANFDYNGNQIYWINSNETGLSRSRNLAMQSANAEICLLADDDLEYHEGYSEIILNEFDRNPNVDIIAFQVNGIERQYKDYSLKKKKIKLLNSFKISSVEIAFRLNRINEKKLFFDEEFGAGSRYYSGEENIFLASCLKSKLKVIYVPITIANLHLGQSSWFKGYTKEYFISKGAAYTKISKQLSFFLILQFALRKYPLYKKDLSLSESIKYMFDGYRLIEGRSKLNG